MFEVVPDPTLRLNTDPDPTLCQNTDPDPTLLLIRIRSPAIYPLELFCEGGAEIRIRITYQSYPTMKLLKKREKNRVKK